MEAALLELFYSTVASLYLLTKVILKDHRMSNNVLCAAF